MLAYNTHAHPRARRARVEGAASATPADAAPWQIDCAHRATWKITEQHAPRSCRVGRRRRRDGRPRGPPARRSAMGANTSRCGVLLAGNDAAGKSRLLQRVKLGDEAVVVTSPNVGVTTELLQPLENVGLEVFDASGGCRFGPALLGMMRSCTALVFVVRASDDRVYSAMWELYEIARAADARTPVCVVVLTESATRPPSEARAGASAGRWSLIAQLAARESLPPGGTANWAEVEKVWAEEEGARREAGEGEATAIGAQPGAAASADEGAESRPDAASGGVSVDSDGDEDEDSYKEVMTSAVERAVSTAMAQLNMPRRVGASPKGAAGVAAERAAAGARSRAYGAYAADADAPLTRPAEWEADRRMVLLEGRTASHGMPVRAARRPRRPLHGPRRAAST